MRRHSDNETRIPSMRYHTQGSDDLYHPIPFLFVTRRMCKDILAERKLILDHTPSAALARQRAMLGRYDPSLAASAFGSVLRMFDPEP